jgi:hypothetical protein
MVWTPRLGRFWGQIAQPPCEMPVAIQCWAPARRLSSSGLVRTRPMAPCQLLRLQKRGRRNDPEMRDRRNNPRMARGRDEIGRCATEMRDG